MAPHDSYDQSGYNAFHYLAAFDPLDLAFSLADDKEEKTKDKALAQAKSKAAEASDEEKSSSDEM